MGNASLFDNQLMALAQYARFVNPLSKYIAQDSDDIWYSHEEEPVFNGHQWVSPSHNTLFPTQPASMYESHSCLLIDDILNNDGPTMAEKLKEKLDSMPQDDFDNEWAKVTSLGMESPSLKEAEDRLIELAKKAEKRGFKWIAQDGKDGIWYGYTSRPKYITTRNEWRMFEPEGSFDAISRAQQFSPNDCSIDFSQQLFNVKDILFDVTDVLSEKNQSAEISESHPITTNPSKEQKALLDLIRVAAAEGYNYIAQDPDDLMWYAYENLPRYTGSLWNAKGRWKELIGTKQMMPAAESLTKISDILNENQ